MTSKGLGWFDPTYYGPTYTEDIEAIDRGMQQGMQFGQMIGENILKSKQMKIDAEERRRGAIADELALAKVDKATREGLILPAEDTGAEALQTSRIDFSNGLVNKLNELKQYRDDGQITAADYAKGVMTLEAQIPAYKSAEKIFYGKVEQYMDGIENGTLSNALSSENKEFLSAMARGDANISFNTNDNGQVEFVGKYKDSDGKEHDLQVALSRMEELPEVLQKPKNRANSQIKADVDNIITTKINNTGAKLNPITGRVEAEPQLIYDSEGNTLPWFNDFAQGSFKTYMEGLGQGDKVAGIKQYLLDAVDPLDKLALIEGAGKMLGIPEDDLGPGYKTVNGLINGLKERKLLDTFINENVMGLWTDKTRNAVLLKNQEIVDEAKSEKLSAEAKLRKDLAAARKAEADALKAENSGSNEGKTPTALETAISDLEEARFNGKPLFIKNKAGVYTGSLPNTNAELKTVLESLGFITGDDLGAAKIDPKTKKVEGTDKGWVVKPQGGGGTFEIKTGESAQEFARKFFKSKKIKDSEAKAAAYTFNESAPYDELGEDVERFKNIPTLEEIVPPISSQTYKGINIK
tara:strand:+ start:1921 stop:3660 length:1740 start_codon:yes stop_codon:yes gene_type:complete